MQQFATSTLFELLPIGAYRSTLHGDIYQANRALLRINGYDNEDQYKADAKVMGADSYVQPYRRDEFKRLMDQHGQVSDFVSETYRLRSGERIWVREHAHLVRDAQGNPLFYEGTIEDITQEHLAQDQLKESASLLRKVLQTIPDRIWLKDLQGTYLTCNDAFASGMGATVDAIVGTRDEVWVGKAMAEQILATDRLATQEGRPFVSEEDMSNPRVPNQGIYEIIKTPLRNAKGDIIGVLGIARDVTAAKAAAEATRQLAFHDSLTGLPNRRLFMDRLERALSHSTRNSQYGALMFLDLDGFKQLNDSQGHDMGDLLLIEVAQRLTKCVRAIDTVGRLGGDEFVVLVQDLSADAPTALSHAGALGNKIMEALNKPYTLGGRQNISTPSIGVSLYLGETASHQEVLKRADVAMYQAKAQGRNTLCFLNQISR